MSRVSVQSFTRQTDGTDVVIGLPRKGVYLALPPEAVEVLDLLAAGHTIEEVRELHRRRHGEDADVQGLVEALEPHGFVRLHGGDGAPRDGESREAESNGAQPANGAVAAATAGSVDLRFHFTGIPQPLARAIFSRPMAALAALLVALATAAWVRHPDLLPGWRSMVFQDNVVSLLLLLMLAGFATTFLHEMGHLVAARARGVDSRLGIGNRLWILVAETDLTGLWQIPRHRRYLPLLAGMAVDLVSAALLMLLLALDLRGTLALHPTLVRFLQALGMIYLLRILWQTFFFVRTDLYYVYANYFGCKNLMSDTRHYLRNRVARLLGREQPFDLSMIPEGERKAIRAYSVFWLLGRLMAFAVLITITVPVVVAYAVQVGRDLATGPGDDPVAFLESSVLAIASLTLSLAGFVLWIRSFRRRRTTSHA